MEETTQKSMDWYEKSVQNRREILQALAAPFPPEAIRQREGGGRRMFDYVETHTVIHRLNSACPEGWSWEINSMDQKGDLYIVIGTLSIRGVGCRSGVGVQRVSERGGEDLVKGASSDALKKAATLFGVALDLYGPDYEQEAEQKKTKRAAVKKPQALAENEKSVGRGYSNKSPEEIAEEHTQVSPFDEPEEKKVEKGRMMAWAGFVAACRRHGLSESKEGALVIFKMLNKDAGKPDYKGSEKDYLDATEMVDETHEQIRAALQDDATQAQKEEEPRKTAGSSAEELRVARGEFFDACHELNIGSDWGAVDEAFHILSNGRKANGNPEEYRQMAAMLRKHPEASIKKIRDARVAKMGLKKNVPEATPAPSPVPTKEEARRLLEQALASRGIDTSFETLRAVMRKFTGKDKGFTAEEIMGVVNKMRGEGEGE